VGVVPPQLLPAGARALAAVPPLFLDKLAAAHAAGRLKFFGDHAALAAAQAFTKYLAPLRRTEWVVYAKKPFGGPQAVLAYLSRYTHRVAIANSRLIACDRNGVTFKYKDYRRDGGERFKTMTLATGEFIRRFLVHVLPDASTVSVTTACSPAARAATPSPAPASCSPCRRNHAKPMRMQRAPTTSQRRSPARVHAAAAA
jgi:hypothetical protein